MMGCLRSETDGRTLEGAPRGEVTRMGEGNTLPVALSLDET
jgi:hypothetical protein